MAESVDSAGSGGTLVAGVGTRLSKKASSSLLGGGAEGETPSRQPAARRGYGALFLLWIPLPFYVLSVAYKWRAYFHTGVVAVLLLQRALRARTAAAFTIFAALAVCFLVQLAPRRQSGWLWRRR